MGDSKDNHNDDLLLDLVSIFSDDEESEGKNEQNQEDFNAENECLFTDKKIEGLIMLAIVEMMKGPVIENFINELISSLDEAYKAKYRHSYHNISLTIYQNLEISEDSLDALSNNMKVLYDHALVRFDSQRDICNCFKKLHDHVSLEIIRINDNKSSIEAVKELISKFKEESEINIEKARRESRVSISNRTRKTMDFLEEKTKPMVSEIEGLRNGLINQTMTILGIFSAIVLAFSGGMIYSSSVLENINKSSAYRILFICLFIGFTLINAIIALLMYLGRIISTNKECEKFCLKKFLISNIFWIVTDLLFITTAFAVWHGWEHSTEKALQDQSNKYYMEKLDKDIEDLNISVSGNQ